MQHGERRGEDQGQGGSSCRMCPLGLPLRAVSSRAAWPGLRRPGAARGSGFCLFRGAWPPCLPGSVTAVSPRARRASARGSRLASCSTCSLWLCCSRCRMMQSPARSLPSRLAGTLSRGRGGGWSQRRGEGGGGRDQMVTSRGTSRRGVRWAPLSTAPGDAPGGSLRPAPPAVPRRALPEWTSKPATVRGHPCSLAEL